MDLTQDAESQSGEAVVDPEQLHQELRVFQQIQGFHFTSHHRPAGNPGPASGALFCRGHVLITGVPGLAKTLLIRSRLSCFI